MTDRIDLVMRTHMLAALHGAAASRSCLIHPG